MRTLIISRNVWNDHNGYSSTMTNVFESFRPDDLANLYIETQKPDTKCCYRFFQISEMSLVKKLLKWRTRTGRYFKTNDNSYVEDSSIAVKEQQTLSYARSHRTALLPIAREILWLFNGWKTRDLKHFLDDFQPDVIWFEGSPLPLMNRLFLYVKRYVKKPSVVFIQDDLYSYEACSTALGYFYRFLLRNKVRKVVKQCQHVFTISPKMKKEYDKIFGIDSTILTKGIPSMPYTPTEIHSPVHMVYLGQTFYGRIYSLLEIAEILKRVNQEETKVVLDIYTATQIEQNHRETLQSNPFVTLHAPVPYDEVQNVMKNSDVVLFVESFEKRSSNVARLSFSTKVTDYMASGKCIFAIGPENIAPIEYLKDNDIAVVATSTDEIEKEMSKLSDSFLVSEYARKSFEWGQKYHSKDVMSQRVHSIINAL